MTTQDELKRIAAEKAVEQVRSGMVVGLGHGSTAIHALRKISSLLKSGELTDIKGVPCSKQVQKDAIELEIPLLNFHEIDVIDLTIDGADEIDNSFNIIKGGGGALLREKIVAQASKKEIIVTDSTKASEKLGTKWAIPIEVIQSTPNSVLNTLKELGGTPVLRKKNDLQVFITDQNNLIYDTKFHNIQDPEKLADQLNSIAGIVEHGLFINLVDEIIIASENGIDHRVK